MGKFISFMLGVVAGALILFALYTRDKGDATVEQTVEEENVELTNEDLLEEYRTMLDEYQKVIQEQQKLLKKYNTPAKSTKQVAAKPAETKTEQPVIKLEATHQETPKAEPVVVKEEAPAVKERNPRYHYFEVRKGNEYVTLHTSMHKDTVEMLFGKPHEVDVHTYGNEVYENWTYKYHPGNLSSHAFRFVNGRLKDVISY